jgi:hypothetical protein
LIFYKKYNIIYIEKGKEKKNMIKVIFKEDREDEFNGLEYTYKDYEGVQVGDIVAVDTRYGYAIAKVTQINVIDTNFINEQLKEVKVVVQSVEEMKRELEKKQKYNELVQKIRKDRLIAEIKNLLSEEELKMVENMTYIDLKKFYDAVK